MNRNRILPDNLSKKVVDRLKAMKPLTFRGQAVLFLLPLIIIISMVYTIESIYTERKILRNEIIKKGETIATIAAGSAELPVLSENLEQLKNAALSVMKIKDVAFVSFLNKRFEILIHEGKKYPQGTSKALNPGMALSFAEHEDVFEFIVPVVTVKAQEGLFLFEGNDSAPPVREHIGWVRIGLSKEVMSKSGHNIMVRGGILAVLFSTAGVLLLYLFVTFITRPLYALINAVKEVGEGEHPEVKVVSPKSEIGKLSSEFNRMSRAIKDREDFLNNIVENIPHMIFVKDAEELRFVRFNKAGEELLGYSREELQGKNSYDLFPQGIAEHFCEKDREVLLSRHIIDFPEEVIHTVHKGERILHSKKIPILDENGKPQYLLGISEDITERKQAEGELERYRDHLEELVGERTTELTIAKEQAESANRAKSEFISNMSHELRTPLNAIMGYTQILKRQDNLTNTQRQQLEIMRSSGEHLLTLINDILDVGKIEACKMKIEDVAFDLPALVRQVISLTKLRADEKELGFKYETDTHLPTYVRGDERKLRQILLNLLSNAVNYTRRGGIVLRVSYDLTGGGLLRCEVEDTGIGIPADKLETIFDPFTQLASSRQVREGTGLGLNITKSLLALMQGRMGVESVLGKGSTFWIEVALPTLIDSDAILVNTDCHIIGYHGERKRILVVDDTIGNTSMLVSLLELLGFELDTAQDGQEAVLRAEEQKPDLVLMDLVMPEMDGLEAATIMRHNRNLEETRIIGASATATDNAHKESFVAVCDDFVVKPIQIDLLLEKIGTQLGIEWDTIIKETENVESGSRTEKHDYVLEIPASYEIEELYELAMMGDMLKIEAWAAELEFKDSRFRCFADRLRELAGGFKTKALLALAEQYREERK
ncbi:MAG: ATP-binding protein [Pedobacter sp.]